MRYLFLLSLRNIRHRADQISELNVKFDANHWNIANDIFRQCANANRNRNLRLSKIRLLFGFCWLDHALSIKSTYEICPIWAYSQKDVVSRVWNCRNWNSHVSKIRYLLPVFRNTRCGTDINNSQSHTKFGALDYKTSGSLFCACWLQFLVSYCSSL